VLWLSSSIKLLYISSNHSELDNVFQTTLEAQGYREEVDTPNDDENDKNKNTGIINTIVNYNSKIKHFENKIFISS
jgi:hypothetical protein